MERTGSKCKQVITEWKGREINILLLNDYDCNDNWILVESNFVPLTQIFLDF